MKCLLIPAFFASFSIAAARVPWTESRIEGLPGPPEPYRLERSLPELNFNQPVEMVWSPNLNRFALLEVDGKVYSFADDQSVSEPDLMIDLGAAANALRAYGLVFHPDFEENRYIYLCYIAEKKGPNGTRVSRFTVRKTEPPTIDSESEKNIITWRSGGHNGCSLQFGPDGCLYISTGDAAPPAPPDGLDTGQDISDLLASILRIDVDTAEAGKPYKVPEDNPFVNLPGARPEVWAYGFRNPWRMSFDQKTGELWVGDVGWEKKEMIYKVRRGGNYGWSVTEGSQAVKPDAKRGPTPILAPTVEHPHSEAKSITGGFVYHGKDLEELTGAYIYGDYITGKIWGLRESDDWHRELTDSTARIICFAPNGEGELYIVDYEGSIYRLAENSTTESSKPFPGKLSETGLFSDIENLKPAPGVIPYEINAGAWHDHASARRLVALPGTTRLGVYERNDAYRGYRKGAWSFPDGAVIAKTLSLEMESGNPGSSRRIETQVLHRHNDQWHAVNFLWNESQTDAALAPDEGSDSVFQVKDAGAPGGVRFQTWRHASRTECMLCHNNRTGNIWSFNIAQLHKGTQLDQLSEQGIFENPLRDDLSAMTDPHDRESGIDERARAYLHVNCTHCHTRGGGGTAMFETRIEFSLERTKLLGAKPTQGNLGLADPCLVAPGDPYRSVLYHRMAKLGPGRMPHFGSQVVDERGLALIRQWITGMSPDDPGATLVGNSKTLNEGKAGSLNSIDQLLARPETALLLSDAITGRELEQTQMRSAVERAARHPNHFVRDLFLRFRDKPPTGNRIGLDPSAAEILAVRGDISNGRTLFRRPALLCLNCHQAEGQGRELGPALDGIGGKFNREQILDQILRPSNTIHPEYVLQVVELKDGNVVSGFIRRQTEAEILLRDAANQDHRISISKIKEVHPSNFSAMPRGIMQNLTTREAADLVDYLRSLR